MQKLTIIILGIAILLAIALNAPAIAAEPANGAKIFSIECVGCHANGGNIIRRGKTLKQKALKRNGLDSIEAIAALVANGKNPMPAYKDRLSAEQIEEVAAYVLEKAQSNWK